MTKGETMLTVRRTTTSHAAVSHKVLRWERQRKMPLYLYYAPCDRGERPGVVTRRDESTHPLRREERPSRCAYSVEQAAMSSVAKK
mmetsp:Transcript_13480/g.30703  ORF Transcript_13480/g.30703 Transcript_13480/m.30703 type:complete len:86 (-) Transcript_13480:2071-2328(-)